MNDTIMTCILVDDEPLARQSLATTIAGISSLKLLDSFSHPQAANDFLRNTKVDLMFLNINMPELSRLDFLKSQKEEPMVIFTTDYPRYALDSDELDAVDYLVKPISRERFLKAVNKAENYFRLMEQTGTSHIERVDDDHLSVKAERKSFRIYFKDILYIEGLKDDVIMYTTDRKIIASMNIKTIGTQLPQALFARVSKSYIVNTLHITSFDNEFVYIAKEEIPLGQSFRDDFLKQYVEHKIVKR